MIDGMRANDVDDGLVRLVVAAVTDTLSSLTRTAEIHQFDRPNSTAHIQRLSEDIAGVTLDAIRSWPRAIR